MRRVEVTVGFPEGLEENGVVHPEMPHPNECFVMTFCEPSEDGDGEDGFTAQASCLCCLQVGATAWLMGKTPEEVQEAMANSGGDDHDHEVRG